MMIISYICVAGQLSKKFHIIHLERYNQLWNEEGWSHSATLKLNKQMSQTSGLLVWRISLGTLTPQGLNHLLLSTAGKWSLHLVTIIYPLFRLANSSHFLSNPYLALSWGDPGGWLMFLFFSLTTSACKLHSILHCFGLCQFDPFVKFQSLVISPSRCLL